MVLSWIKANYICCCSVAKSCLTSGNHGLQCTRLSCPSLSPGVCSHSCSLCRCHPTISSSVVSLLFLPLAFLSIRVFSNEAVLRIRWPEYWSISFSISPSSEYSGLISFRMDWLDLLAVQGTLNSLLQHHYLKTSVFGSHPSYDPTLTSIKDFWKKP